ncbi:MAG: hypothetical protein IPM54_28320 [Polyangiaceae bacterium]|nr:hypothetical protein [Polyangiaceae bacterium]
MSTSQNSSGNPILDNPGVSATVFAIVVALGFVGALYQSATSHHGDAHGGTHNAAPAKH